MVPDPMLNMRGLKFDFFRREARRSDDGVFVSRGSSADSLFPLRFLAARCSAFDGFSMLNFGRGACAASLPTTFGDEALAGFGVGLDRLDFSAALAGGFAGARDERNCSS